MNMPNPNEYTIWVTGKNWEWASEMTGLSIEELKRRYDKAFEEGFVCTVTVNNGKAV